MEHLTDIQLLELIGGHLRLDDRAGAEDHLAACESCRRQHEQLARTWEVLGQWDPVPAGRDLSEMILATATWDRKQRFPRVWRRFAMVMLKAAASIVLAAGIGYAAGRSYRPAPSPPAANIEQQAASSIYLDTFESGTPAGLSEFVLAASKASGEKEQ